MSKGISLFCGKTMSENKTDVSAIIADLEKQFNGDMNHDVEVMRSYCRSLERTNENLAIVTAIGKYVSEKFPEADAVKEAKKFEETFVHFQELIEEGQKCMHEKKYEDALAKFREVIGDVKPATDDSKYYCSFSHPFEEMLFRTGYKEGKEIERISTLPETLYYQCGVALLELGRYAEAKAEYMNALKLNPVSARTHFELITLAKMQKNYDEARRLLKEVYPCLFTRIMLARFYREHAGLALIDEKYDLARALIYLSLDYEDTPQARAQLNSLAKHRGVDLSKPSAEAVKQKLHEYDIPCGPAQSVYNLALYIGNQMKKAYPDVAKMAFGIAYDITHYKPLLKEL